MEVLFVVVVFMSNREIQDRAYRLRRLFFDLLMAFFFEEWFFSLERIILSNYFLLLNNRF